MKIELTTDLADPRIRYVFLQSAYPSSAEGTFDGHSFYLRANNDWVTFTISRKPGVDAIDFYDLADYDLVKTQADDRLRFPDEWVQAYEECFHVEEVLDRGEGSVLSENRKLNFIKKWCAEFDLMGRCAFKRLGPRIDWNEEQGR